MVQLDELNEIKIDYLSSREEITGDIYEFPKYTTQLINLANGNAGGTRPAVVGQMTTLVPQCPTKTYEGWKDWYLMHYPSSINEATDKIYNMLINCKDAMDCIDKEMVQKWVEDLIFVKTIDGLIIQEIIFNYVSSQLGLEWRNATPSEESKNIDGFIGDMPIQIKPTTYSHTVSTVNESINIETIYYKTTDKYLTIYTNML